MATSLKCNASSLRLALRLIHCLQRERGASCTLAGRNNAVSQRIDNVRLARARTATNSAIYTFYQRGVVPSKTSDVASKLFTVRQSIDQGQRTDKQEFWFVHTIIREFSSLLSDVRGYVIDLITPRIENTLTLDQDELSIGKQREETTSLLKLLLLFVELKESLGVERATLTGLMSIGNVDNNTDNGIDSGETQCQANSNTNPDEMNSQRVPPIVNDVVMVVENQHRILLELQVQSGIRVEGQHKDADNDQCDHDEESDNDNERMEITTLDPHLLNLVGESIKLSSEMQSLQDYIRKDFDICGFLQGMTMDELWYDITLYMDKLHSMELLLLEELDQCDNRMDELDLLSLGSSNNSSHSQLHFAMKSAALEHGDDVLLKDSTQNVDTLSGEEVFLSHEVEVASDQLKKVDSNIPCELKEWEISLYDIQFQRRIGRGAAGTTYLATYVGQRVAVKVASISDLGLDGWRTELTSLKQLHHPNIIRFLGAIYNSSPLTYCLVLEYCDQDLCTALEGATPAGFVLKVALDIGHGLCYLHKKNIMHRDIKPSNCLLQGDVKSGHYCAKLTDFGVAAMVQNSLVNQGDLTAETGTYRYMAPEVIRHESYTYTADVYSYTLLLWELITREVPFEPLGQIESAGLVAFEGSRPPFPSEMPSSLKAVIERGWVDCPEDRISLPAIIEWLENANNHLTQESITWLDKPYGHPVYTARSDMMQGSPKDHKKRISHFKRMLFGRKKRNDTFDRLR